MPSLRGSPTTCAAWGVPTAEAVVRLGQPELDDDVLRPPCEALVVSAARAFELSGVASPSETMLER
jgi:hypothetical protein